MVGFPPGTERERGYRRRRRRRRRDGDFSYHDDRAATNTNNNNNNNYNYFSPPRNEHDERRNVGKSDHRQRFGRGEERGGGPRRDENNRHRLHARGYPYSRGTKSGYDNKSNTTTKRRRAETPGRGQFYAAQHDDRTLIRDDEENRTNRTNSNSDWRWKTSSSDKKKTNVKEVDEKTLEEDLEAYFERGRAMKREKEEEEAKEGEEEDD